MKRRIQILKLLVEGVSVRAITRAAGCDKETVLKMLVSIGEVCLKFHDERVVNVRSHRVQCDEIWSFVYCKEKNVAEAKGAKKGSGDAWTWIGIDADTKLVISYLVGRRTPEDAKIFMMDVAARLKNRVQLTCDGLRAYLDAVDDAFGGNIDFAQLVKIYGAAEGTGNEKRYSPGGRCIGAKKVEVYGKSDLKHISTSFVERQNLTMRMNMRRFTRLTNAFSKKLQNHAYAVALHYVHYNFMRVHQSLRVTPAMEAGLINDFVSWEELVNRMEY